MKAGKVKELDAIIYKFVAASSDEKKEVLKSIKAVSKEAKAPEKVVKVYKKALEKTLENPGYPAKEIARLTKIVASGTASLEKRDEFSVKLNILKTFTSPVPSADDAETEGSNDEL